MSLAQHNINNNNNIMHVLGTQKPICCKVLAKYFLSTA